MPHHLGVQVMQRACWCRGGVASSRTKPPQAAPSRARHQVATESLGRWHHPHSNTAQRGLQALQAFDSGQDGGALTVEDLQQLAEQDMQLLQAELGSAWRAQFEDDLEGLYAFADRWGAISSKHDQKHKLHMLGSRVVHWCRARLRR